MFRRILFWSHLSAGVLCGLVILMMSVTGVLLTYERQIIALAERAMYHEPSTQGPAAPVPAAQLLDNVSAAMPEFVPTSLTISADPLAPAVLAAGRSGRVFVDRYTGRVLDDAAAGTRAFFGTITGWHRWFDVEGEHRDTARAVTGASNLAFLFLVVSGAWLWLPPVFNRVAFRVRVLFNPRAHSSKARDYNWHHVFGIWTVVPLLVIVASATVFNYDWANSLLYRAVGDTPPERGGGPPAASREAAPDSVRAASPDPAPEPGSDKSRELSLDEWLDIAAAASAGWQSLTLTLPQPADAEVRVSVDHGNGGQPQRRATLVLDAESGSVTATETFASLPAGRRARSWVRFLHTGEALGIAGQTIAGIVSFTSILMVWTGIALAWRRLVSPVLRRRRLAAEAT